MTDQNTFETIEWFQSLDVKCRFEAIIAGHVAPSPQTRPMAGTPLTIVSMTINGTTPHGVVIQRKNEPQSPLMTSCQNGIKRIAKSSRNFSFTEPQKQEITASPYRSPSPEIDCCGLLVNGHKEMCHA